jgi:hypothetical protein
MAECTSSIPTAAGAKLYTALTLPATYDQTGFEAVSWTRIAQITDYGSIGGNWQEVNTTLVDEDEEVTTKGVMQYGTMPISHIDNDDTGKDMIETQFTNKTCDYPYKIECTNGRVLYFKGKVMGNETNLGTGGDAMTVTRNIKQTGRLIKTPLISKFAITFAAGENGSIAFTQPDTSNPQLIAAGGTTVKPVLAIADTGYQFEKWSDNSVQNPRTTIPAVTAAATLTATFILS